MDDFVDEYPFLFFGTLMVGLVVLLPGTLIFTIISCTAWSRTREWKKEKAAQRFLPTSESDALIKSEEDESDLDPDDSEDEAELQVREEKRRDLSLTTKQYFWKQMSVGWKGDKNVKNEQKAKERKERQKMARAIAKEFVKLEKKRNRKMVDGERADAAGLPAYGYAAVEKN